MKVNRYNYQHQLGPDLPLLMKQIETILREGRYILSAEVTAFEEGFAAYLGCQAVLGVGSGTDAIYLSLKSLGVGPGDEVITQANTFHATVSAICQTGAKPVLVDADTHSFLIDSQAVEAAVTERTRVIMPVHLYGKPTQMDPLLAIATKKNLYVVEDAAQAHGAVTGGRRVGSIGVLGCFSFHPSKNLAAAGDGGAIAVGDTNLLEDLRCRRALGQHDQNQHILIGLNSKLDALQAAVLHHKLPHLDTWNARRAELAAVYRQRLKNLPLGFQETNETERHVYHLFQIRTTQRDSLHHYLKENGIDVVVRYPVPIHLQPAFADLGYARGSFPVAEDLASTLLALPIRPDMREVEIDRVCNLIEKFFAVS